MANWRSPAILCIIAVAFTTPSLLGIGYCLFWPVPGNDTGLAMARIPVLLVSVAGLIPSGLLFLRAIWIAITHSEPKNDLPPNPIQATMNVVDRSVDPTYRNISILFFTAT